MLEIVVFGFFGLLGGLVSLLLADAYLNNDQSFKLRRVHCDNCSAVYSWFQLVPVLNLFTGKACRGCKKPLPCAWKFFPVVTGVLYALVYLEYDLSATTILYCLAIIALIALSVVDWRIQEIPIQLNYFIFVLGLINLLLDLRHWAQYVIGFFAVSGLLFLLLVCTKGRGMGGGDVKLMATAGLLIGWKLILLSLMIGSILGSIIHLSIMKIKKAERVLAFGPYLSMGIIIAMIWGQQLISWYLGLIIPNLQTY